MRARVLLWIREGSLVQTACMRVALISGMVVLSACVVDHQGLSTEQDGGLRDTGGDPDTGEPRDAADAADAGDSADAPPMDECPADPEKRVPGACGCGSADVDVDGDGIYACETCEIGFVCGDCNDGDDTVGTGLPELCNDADEDCDGEVDEGETCVGCADATREGFIDYSARPRVAACAGSFLLPGVIHSVPTCERRAGNDGALMDGEGCSAADLCAPGWSLCDSAERFVASEGDCAALGLPPAADLQFFVSGASGLGGASCDGAGANDLFGCGNFGYGDFRCPEFNMFVPDCMYLVDSEWRCPSPGDVTMDAATVTKPGLPGGVLCCRD